MKGKIKEKCYEGQREEKMVQRGKKKIRKSHEDSGNVAGNQRKLSVENEGVNGFH